MHSTPFHLLQLTEIPHLTPLMTDTASPQQHIPIYFIHSLEHPFCRDHTCQCHSRQQEVKRLLGNILEGNLTLREAANLIDIDEEGREV